MMYPFLTLDDKTEIVHSEMREDGSVKVYMERPDEKDCFHYATCYLPEYKWCEIFGFTNEELERLREVIGFIFGQMKMNRLNQSMFMCLKVHQVRMEPKFGLQSPENVICVIIIPKFHQKSYGIS